MGRPKTFDDDQVLDQAVACFRQHGFSATSVRELEDATGLKAASIYKAFGNKASLFALALARYRSEILDRRIDTYLMADRGVDGIREFFRSTYLSEPWPDQGCLFTTTAVNAAQVDAAARSHVESGLTAIRAALHAQLGRCFESDEIEATVDVSAAAQVLLVLYEGLLVLLRSGSDVVAFDEMIDAAIGALLL